MKLASLKNHSRDGQLLVVNRALTEAVLVPHIANTMQYALDHWDACYPALQHHYELLNQGELTSVIPFETTKLASPLPRAYQWLDGSAYVNHVELVRQSRGVAMSESFWHDPLMYQGGSDVFLSPCDNIPLLDPNWGLDFEAEVAVIVKDVPIAANTHEAAASICLVTLVNDVSLRHLARSELAKGFGFVQSKPSSAFSPVAVTPDELGDSWDGRKVHLPILTHFNDELFGCPNAGIDMTFDFPTLIAHAAKTRGLCAGTIIGSGTVSNYDRSRGSSCIVEKRMLESLHYGEAITPFLQVGDRIRIEMFDHKHQNIFGAICQHVIDLRSAYA